MRSSHMNRAFLCALVVVTILQQAGVCAAQSATPWGDLVGELRYMYFNQNMRSQAITTMQDYLEAHGNGVPDDLLRGFLEMPREYFSDVSPTELARFRELLLAMFKNQSWSRINRIVNYFGGPESESLFQVAAEARRYYFTPAEARFLMEHKRTTVDMDATAVLSFVAFNFDGMQLRSWGELRVWVEDTSIASLEEDASGEGKVTIRGRQAGETRVVLYDKQENLLDEAEIVVRSRTALMIEPPMLSLVVGETKGLKITADRPLDVYGGVELTWEPSGKYLRVKEFPIPPGSYNQHLEVTALRALGDDIKLNARGPDDSYTFTIITIEPLEPTPPSMRWPLAGSAASAGLVVLALTSQADANDLFDQHESAMLQDDLDEGDALHSEYEDAQTTATISWVAAGAVTATTGYMWYKYLSARGKYNKELEEYNRLTSSLHLRLGRVCEVGVQFRF